MDELNNHLQRESGEDVDVYGEGSDKGIFEEEPMGDIGDYITIVRPDED